MLSKPVAPARDESGGQDAQEAGEANDLDACPGQDPVELGLERLPVRKPTIIDRQGRYACSLGTGETQCVRPVAHDQRHLRRCSGLGGLIDQRL